MARFFFPPAGGGGAGASVTVSPTAPEGPSQGNLWFNSSTAETFIYYEDETSAQWVQIAP